MATTTETGEKLVTLTKLARDYQTSISEMLDDKQAIDQLAKLGASPDDLLVDLGKALTDIDEAAYYVGDPARETELSALISSATQLINGAGVLAKKDDLDALIAESENLDEA